MCCRKHCSRQLRDEAAFWFYAGQLRARFDANRCADACQTSGRCDESELWSPINRHLFQDLDKAQELIAKVVDWDRRTPHAYDPHWINRTCRRFRPPGTRNWPPG
jgi:hypothetical protein